MNGITMYVGIILATAWVVAMLVGWALVRVGARKEREQQAFRGLNMNEPPTYPRPPAPPRPAGVAGTLAPFDGRDGNGYQPLPRPGKVAPPPRDLSGVAPVQAPSTREVMQQALAALETAHTGLMWYRGMMPDYVDGSDGEADEEIMAAIEGLRAALTPKENGNG